MSQPAPCRIGPKASSRVIEALRRHVKHYLSRFAPDPTRMHVLYRLLACRTEKLGWHLCVCETCGWRGLAVNSCRDRHCPQCQGSATNEWLEARQARMLPTPHFQVVFTLPSELRPIAFDNQKLVYALLFKASAGVLQDLAAQHLNAQLGLTAVLHTWSTKLSFHPHIHFMVTAGGLKREDESWASTSNKFLFLDRIMGAMFRGRFLEGLIDAVKRGELKLRGSSELEANKAFHSTVRDRSLASCSPTSFLSSFRVITP